MAATSKRHVFTGILFILIGVALLIGQVSDVDYSWTFLLMGLGLAFLLRDVIERRPSSIFVGVLLLLLGFVFFADEQHWYLFGVNDAWPFVPLVVGIAFLMDYIFSGLKKGGILLTAVILIAVGLLFVLAESRAIDWRTVGDILEWWPVALLIIGVYLLVKPGKKKEDNQFRPNISTVQKAQEKNQQTPQ